MLRWYSRSPLARFAAAVPAIGLLLWACASNPPGDLEAKCKQSIASADQLVVTTIGIGFPTEIYLLQGSHKDNFAQELAKVLSVDYQGFLWAGRIATARPGGSVDVLRNGTCDKSFVFRKSRGVPGGDAINKLMEEIRSLAREGEPIPEESLPKCARVDREGLFFWFGIPWEYEYVLRPRSSP
jgi:hypothetical protein